MKPDRDIRDMPILGHSISYGGPDGVTYSSFWTLSGKHYENGCRTGPWAAISALAFAQRYAQGRVTVDWLAEHDRRPFACSCGDESCEGFAMLSEEGYRDEMRRGRISDVCGWVQEYFGA